MTSNNRKNVSQFRNTLDSFAGSILLDCYWWPFSCIVKGNLAGMSRQLFFSMYGKEKERGRGERVRERERCTWFPCEGIRQLVMNSTSHGKDLTERELERWWDVFMSEYLCDKAHLLGLHLFQQWSFLGESESLVYLWGNEILIDIQTFKLTSSIVMTLSSVWEFWVRGEK